MAGFLRRVVALDAHAKIEPRSLAGDGVRIRALDAVCVARDLLVDEVIEEESVVELGRVGRELPRALALADRVPGPHGAGRRRRVRARLRADAPARRGNPDPVAVGDVCV